MENLWNLFVAFFRSNIVGFGGGPASIPLIRKEVVDVFEWMTNEEFANALAIGNSLPGPIATKLAAYIGYQVGGVSGAIISIVATVGPTAIAMILLFSFLMKYKDTAAIKGLMKAIQPVIVILLLQVVYEMSKSTYNHYTMGLGLITVGAFIGVFFLGIHPVFLIILSMLTGIVFSKFIL
ncbi:chromate transporter [Desulfuribacillus stibiiarsenatis]|uniref:Chromate transporter n=1 Tax=Desulfuribacillus stibiiarsenatis TaxID=1390249 RepID=A0A1E5L4A0_9FIRM|nr:chromate transporter [Desulfuribacillus stibiiarsenatis]OEH84769.1 chromate transporter [Desulfuribacillus stibiiarsenatis]